MRRLTIMWCLVALLLIGSAQGTWAQQPNFYELGTYPGGTWFTTQPNFYELGTYPGGTWFTTQSVNELGVVVGRGDVPGPDGVLSNHTLAVPLFGPYAGHWIDLGALGGVQPTGFEYEAFAQISDTGLVVSRSTAGDGYEHAVAWTRETGMVDLGTLADTGDPAYAAYKLSRAAGTNRPGTLIVGSSYTNPDHTDDLPLVWTPARKPGGLAIVWKMHRLATTAEFPYCQAWWMNDIGQIAGACGNNANTVTGAVWNVGADGKDWQITLLPPDPDYPNSNAYGINNIGEIAGVVMTEDFGLWLPRLWKPLNMRRTKYSRPIELALPSGFGGCESVGINDMGDIVGDCWSDTQDLPARWTTARPSFSELIKFPGSFGYSWCVTNNRIAAVTYNGSKCPTDDTTCGGAIKLHSLR